MGDEMKKECQRGKDHKWTSIRRLGKYEVSGFLGTPFHVFLHDAVDEKYCGRCNEVLGHVVPEPKSLSAVVAVLRATRPRKLSGSEIKFLRKSLSRKAKELAEEMAVSPEQLSRFENDKQPISEVYERLLRATVCLGHFDVTHQLGIKTKELLSMKIDSVHDCENDTSFHLSFGVVSSPKSSDQGKRCDWEAFRVA